MTKTEELCRTIERAVGKPIATAQDFVWLSDQIMESQHQVVGVNTLKRLWGYMGDGQVMTRRGTLDVLAQFVGFRDYMMFCKQDNGRSSNFVLSRYTETKQLAAGMFIRISWQPDRVCTVEHLGQSRFIIREVVNSKLSVDDTFECAVLIENEPLYLNNLIHEGQPPVRYVAGRKSGIRFEVMEQ